ncbi:MAG: GNAT family N-acetyltransferase [Propionibacteriaceae bacterium]
MPNEDVSLTTDRLILRSHRDTDATRVLQIHSDLDIIRWLGNPPFVPMADLSAARAWIAERQPVNRDDPFHRTWAIEVRETGQYAGHCGVGPTPPRLDGAGGTDYEVGWTLHPDTVGHGHATEAAVVALDHAFSTGLELVWCDMYPDNAPSIGVALRLGLDDQGVVDDPWYGDDSRMFRITAAQWRALRAERGPDPESAAHSGASGAGPHPATMRSR